MAVRPDSSDPGISGVRPVPVDADHVEICKPDDRSSDVYVHVRAFVERPIAPFRSQPEERQKRSEQAIFQTINTPSGGSGGITNNITINMFGAEGIDKLKEFLREVGSYGRTALKSEEEQE